MSFWKRLFSGPSTLSESLQAFERKKRAGVPQPEQPSVRDRQLAAIPHRSAWSLVLWLVHPRQSHVDDVARAIHDELEARRGKTKDDIGEMTKLAAWAMGVINPIDGGTAESHGKVHQIVADFDDLEWAVDIAEQKNLLSRAELDEKRDLIRRHIEK
jgi:hypothetical protein